MFFALILPTVLVVTVSSCQKDSVSPNLQSTISNASTSLFSNYKGKHKKPAPTTPTKASPTSPAVVSPTSPTGPGLGSLTVVSPISLTGVSNITIRGDSINGGTVPCISLSNCTNITITHCKLINSTTTGVNLSNCVNILVDSSYISNVSSGVYAINCQTIQVVANQMLNMVGPYPRGQFVQFNAVSGAGNSVINNKCENIMGSSYPEDAISMYKTNGTAASPVTITGNWIRGGGAKYYRRWNYAGRQRR